MEGRFPERSRVCHAHAITRLAGLGRSASQMSPKRSAGCGESAGCHAEWVLLRGRRKQDRTDTSCGLELHERCGVTGTSDRIAIALQACQLVPVSVSHSARPSEVDTDPAEVPGRLIDNYR